MFVPLILRHLIVAYSESKMLSIITLAMVNINCISMPIFRWVVIFYGREKKYKNKKNALW